jgi:predicted nucleic acid-binding protein
MSEKPPNLICDTSFVGHLANRDKWTDHYEKWGGDTLARIETASLAVSVVTVAEARAGYLGAGWSGSRLAAAEAQLKRFSWIPVDREHADEWARLSVAARSNGVAISDNDLWIAATASVRGQALVTCDRDHVRIAPELGVEVVFLQPPV